MTTVRGAALPLPHPTGLTHLQFRRFAGCPVCNLHLRSFERRHDEILAAAVHCVVVFHSPADELRPHVAHLPFPVIADPDKALYREFGVESSPMVMVRPRSWPVIVHAVLRTMRLLSIGRAQAPRLRPHGGRYGKPADFLFNRKGVLLASKYGEHLDDNWSVDDLLSLASACS